MRCDVMWCLWSLNEEAVYQFSIVKTSSAQKLFLLSKLISMKWNELIKRHMWIQVVATWQYTRIMSVAPLCALCVCWNIDGNRIRTVKLFEMENGCLFTSTSEWITFHSEFLFISCVRRMKKNERYESPVSAVYHLVIFWVIFFPMICFFVGFTFWFPHSHSHI